MSLLPALLLLVPVPSFSLILPPSQKIKMGMGEQLKDECEDLSYDYDLPFFYGEGISEGHEVGKHLFESLTECAPEGGGLVFYPEYENYAGALEKVSATLEQCKDLTGMSCTLTHWPDTPATCLRFEAMPDVPLYDKEGDDDIESQIEDTKQYVDNTLSGLGLCPFTKSMKLSALGLESSGVQSGPVQVRHASKALSSPTSKAAAMARMYWEGVNDILALPETEVATFLLVCPSLNFKDYFTICDRLIEPCNCLAPGAVGRVWFHPEYKLSEVGYQSGGHAPPLSELKGLMTSYTEKHPVGTPPDSDMERAHDLVRWTPHPTINLLRPKQLEVAREQDTKGLRGEVYPRNVVRILKAEKEGETFGLPKRE